MEFSAKDYLDFEQTEHGEIFDDSLPVWSAIAEIGSYLEKRLDSAEGPLLKGKIDPRAIVGDRVYVAPDATIEANAVIQGPAWIGAGTTIRSGAYVREQVVVGENCTLGNSSEFKNCLLFNHCEVPHFNYVGDSILGYKAHLGAGVICSNVRLDRETVRVKHNGYIDTGLRKFGAIIGDRTEIGCNSVLSPGSLLGRDCIIYPLTSWQGVLGDRQIVKTRPDSAVVARHGSQA